mmetsp:Transcript_13890/g.54869  ORF Transcript_13890/g.54869 Transcript_13890/m.54869 type:complete len:208 (+) Transcript_13890:1896-2519(+)
MERADCSGHRVGIPFGRHCTHDSGAVPERRLSRGSEGEGEEQPRARARSDRGRVGWHPPGPVCHHGEGRPGRPLSPPVHSERPRASLCTRTCLAQAGGGRAGLGACCPSQEGGRRGGPDGVVRRSRHTPLPLRRSSGRRLARGAVAVPCAQAEVLCVPPRRRVGPPGRQGRRRLRHQTKNTAVDWVRKAGAAAPAEAEGEERPAPGD